MMKNGGPFLNRPFGNGILLNTGNGKGTDTGVQRQNTGKMDEGTDFQRGEQSAGQRGKNAAETVRGMQERHTR